MREFSLSVALTYLIISVLSKQTQIGATELKTKSSFYRRWEQIEIVALMSKNGNCLIQITENIQLTCIYSCDLELRNPMLEKEHDKRV